MTDDQAVTLREYFESLWEAHGQVHASEKEAVAVALTVLKERLEDMNQFREQIQEERGFFLSKVEYESRHRELGLIVETGERALNKRVSDLELSKSNMDGRLWAAGAALTVITVLLNVAFRFWGR